MTESDYKPLTEEEQLALFGYYDPEPPFPGSWKDAACRLYRESSSNDEMAREIRETHRRMVAAQGKFIRRFMG